jgi:hypothetical protein
MKQTENIDYYIDEKTGYKVLTEDFLRRRGKCCLSNCRHCPYKKENKNEPEQNQS